MYGHAADLYCPGVPYGEVAAVARAHGLGVIEYPYQQFDHVEIWLQSGEKGYLYGLIACCLEAVIIKDKIT
ncbi:hypothetical protein M5595_08220 [Eubacterium limosum]|uniref:hypothetical protein n=1 Tax=Eubacterium limosum TaxID=1736 RepID=UPI001FA83706|nr:hypothetical protein [Eubacterium limosum]UQZ24707.1 hypothetical protein M5595_08220 [Eubacterium limosum]